MNAENLGSTPRVASKLEPPKEDPGMAMIDFSVDARITRVSLLEKDNMYNVNVVLPDPRTDDEEEIWYQPLFSASFVSETPPRVGESIRFKVQASST